jgi:hypothetical protein
MRYLRGPGNIFFAGFCRREASGHIGAAEQAGFPKTRITLPFYLIERRLACQYNALHIIEDIHYMLSPLVQAGARQLPPQGFINFKPFLMNRRPRSTL